MKDKNGSELIGVVGFQGLSRAEDDPQCVWTPWGTGFVWVVSPNEVEIMLDGGGTFRTSNADAVEVIE